MLFVIAYNGKKVMIMKASRKFKGVFINPLEGGDFSLYIGYTDINTKKYIKFKVGLKSNGITETYCHNLRNEIINKMRLGENPDSKFSNKKNISFDSLAQEYFKSMELQQKSIKNIKNDKSRYNNHINPYIGKKNAYSVNAEDLNKIKFDKKEFGLSDTTVNHIISLIGTIFNHAIAYEIFSAKNPANSIKVTKFKIDNARQRFLSIEEVRILLNDERIKNNSLLDIFCKISITTGARLSTILNIRKKDINIQTRTVTLHNLKTKSIYFGYLSENFLPDLSFVSKLKPNDFVVSKNGMMVEQTRIQHPLKKILDELFNNELDKKDSANRVVIHTLRHSFASILAINGTPIYTIQKLLDHKDQAMTQRYAKLSPDSALASVRQVFAL